MPYPTEVRQISRIIIAFAVDALAANRECYGVLNQSPSCSTELWKLS